MTISTKLLRGMFLALALLCASPLAGLALGVPTVQAQDQRLVAAVLFEGNVGFSDSALLGMVNVGERGSFTDASLAADAESIRLAYVNKGYTSVSVTPKVEAAGNGRSRITFVVNEGQRTGIVAINFTGNNAINSGTLKSIIRTHETGFLSWLFRDDSYSEDQVAIDRQLIEYYYANHGYPDAQVTSAVAEFDPAKNGYFVNFTIVEGDRYQFGKIGVETSVPGLNADLLTGAIRTHEGGRYSLGDLSRSQEDMALEATLQGYAFADVRPRVDRDAATGVFNVTYLVDEGPRIYVERINITGNSKTRDAVIRRELDFGEGDPFNRSMVARGKTAIEALGFFKTVNVNFSQGSSSDKVVIDIAVEEQSTGDYGLTAGYSSDDGVLGEVSVTERNFLGRGQYVRASISASGSGQSFDFSFTEPHFMGLDISSGFDLYHRINEESRGNTYGTTATGGQLRFGLPITPDLTGSLFVGAEQKSIEDNLMYDPDGNPNTDNDILAPTSNIVDDGDVYTKEWLGLGLTFNTLDDQKHPTSGLTANLTTQYIHGDYDDASNNVLKTEAKARYFMPLLEDANVIGSVKAQAGIINALDGDGNVHPLEAFSHSSSLVRGFQNKGMGPRLDLDGFGGNPGDPGEYLGYTQYAALSAEVEFPIPVLPETYGVRGAIWADAAWIDGFGTTSDSNVVPVAGSTGNFKSSVGASVIWDSPFGPLRGDFAYVLNKDTLDHTQVFSLTLQNIL